MTRTAYDWSRVDEAWLASFIDHRTYWGLHDTADGMRDRWSYVYALEIMAAEA